MFSILIASSLLISAGCVSASEEENHICPVHKCEMEMKRIDFMYDMPDKAYFDYDKIRKGRFPNCDDQNYAGDAARIYSYEERYICEQCNIARDQWAEKNQNRNKKKS